jgi:transcriptional regulator CtsR
MKTIQILDIKPTEKEQIIENQLSTIENQLSTKELGRIIGGIVYEGCPKGGVIVC